MNKTLTTEQLIELESYIRGLNPKMNPDKAGSFASVIMETEGAKDFYKREGGGRKHSIPEFPYGDLVKRTAIIGDCLISEAGYSVMVKNLIKKFGGDPTLWTPKKASGMKHKTKAIMESDDGETTYLRLYIKMHKRVRMEVEYKLSDGTSTTKDDKRFEKWAKPAKKSYIPTWIQEVGITDVEGFLEEFNRFKVMSVKKDNIAKLKVGSFDFSR